MGNEKRTTGPKDIDGEDVPSSVNPALLPTVPVPALPIFHRCGCGRAYTLAAWRALPDRKLWTVEDCDTLEVWTYEQRQCACGSHLCHETEPKKARS